MRPSDDVPIVYACVTPHGGEVVPSLAGKRLKQLAPTRAAMRKIAVLMKEARPDTIVIATPHNLRMPKHIGVVIAENSSGTVTNGRKRVRLRAKCDVDFANRMIEVAEQRGLPVAGANYGALEGPLSDLAMDWGTLVPLWFLLRGRKAKIVIVTPARGVPLEQNFEFGRAVADAAEREEKRVAFVASADQAHAHKKSGPYGYDRRAEEYDRRVADAIRGNELETIMRMDPDFVAAACPDSLWQMTMLAGVSSVVPMEGELLSYQVPTYYGMLCASFRRTVEPHSGA